MAGPVESLPLPEHPLLAAWASVLNDTGFWAHILDAQWRYVFETEELRSTYADMRETVAPVPLGSHFFATQSIKRFSGTQGGPYYTGENLRAWFLEVGPFMLASTPGARDELRRNVDPALTDLVEDLHPREFPVVWEHRPRWTTAGSNVSGSAAWIRIDDIDGSRAGVCLLSKPGAGMSDLARAAATANLMHLRRMRVVERPGRRPAAILMADLEASSPLARHLSTAQYFAFVRRLVRAADQCVIDAGGIVGRHAGDGVVAFFVVDTTGSESAAARACITAARTLRSTLADIAARSDLSEVELSCGSGCTGARRCTWARSSPVAAAKSRHSATKSTRPRGSKRARPVALLSRQSRSSNDSTAQTPTR